MQDRGHRRKQRLRNVLRHRAEQLSHAGRSARGAGRWLAARHRRPAQRRGLSPKPCSLVERNGASGRRHLCRYRTCRAHSPQVQDQEHHRLQPKRAHRLRGPDRDNLAPHDRLGGHAWLPLAYHLSHRRRRSMQGQRAGLLSNHRNRLPGRHSTQAAARLGGRTARPFRPALGRGQARTAVGPAHLERASGRPADRGARRQHPASRTAHECRAWRTGRDRHRRTRQFFHRPRHMRDVLEGAQRGLPLGGRHAPRRNHRHHRGRCLSH